MFSWRWVQVLIVARAWVLSRVVSDACGATSDDVAARCCAVSAPHAFEAFGVDGRISSSREINAPQRNANFAMMRHRISWSNRVRKLNAKYKFSRAYWLTLQYISKNRHYCVVFGAAKRDAAWNTSSCCTCHSNRKHMWSRISARPYSHWKKYQSFRSNICKIMILIHF